MVLYHEDHMQVSSKSIYWLKRSCRWGRKPHILTMIWNGKFHVLVLGNHSNHSTQKVKHEVHNCNNK